MDILSGSKKLRPSFLIIGAQKSGTTAMFSMLAEHPRIMAPEVKELHFFDKYDAYAGGIDAYWDQFPKGKKNDLTFEATPDYIWKPGVAELIAKELPHNKLVLVLRDPVSRAHSAWNMFRDFKDSPKFSHLHDPRSFEQAVKDELAGKTDLPAHKYVERGYYADQILAYQKHFDKQDMLIIGYTSFLTHPAQVVNGVLRFLGLDAMPEDLSIFHVKKNKRPYVSKLGTELQEELEAHYQPHNQRLREVVGEHFEF